MSRKAPYRLTSFVQANQTVWVGGYAAGDGLRHHFYASDIGGTYRPGEQVSVRWVALAQNSGLPDTPGQEFMGARRQEDGLLF